MITRKDLAPLDDTSLELWRNTLKHRKDETLYALYALMYFSTILVMYHQMEQGLFL